MDSDSSISEPVRKVVEELSTGEENLSNALLAEFSNLNQSEMAFLITEWDLLAEEQRLHIVSRLFEMAEDNIEFNFDSIFKYCLQDRNEDIRCLAIEGLWENEETSLIKPLVDLLENDESDKVQAAAALALGKFVEKAEFGKLRPVFSEQVKEALLSAVDDRNRSPMVIRRVLEAVAPLSVPDVSEAIQDAYETDDAYMIISAIYAMGKSCNKSWIPVLLKELENDDPEIRFEAAGALGELEEEESVPYLINLVNDDDMEVRLKVIQSLGKIGTASARECLGLCLESTSDAIRDAAESAIQEINASDDPLSFRT
ncbi:MAG: HEAT repeat domain-containing protein [Dehalococcoidales bacterium]|nr:HEAT repeat domain-containing protein [Dehalococcoidales bacterium]